MKSIIVRQTAQYRCLSAIGDGVFCQFAHFPRVELRTILANFRNKLIPRFRRAVSRSWLDKRAVPRYFSSLRFVKVDFLFLARIGTFFADYTKYGRKLFYLAVESENDLRKTHLCNCLISENHRTSLWQFGGDPEKNSVASDPG